MSRGESSFIGEEVEIYPNDTNSRWGYVREMSDKGVTFTITRDHQHMARIGDLVFIAYSANLSFRLPGKRER